MFNYLFDEGNTRAALPSLFARIHAALRPGGLLVFDLAAPGVVPAGRNRTWTSGADWAVLVENREKDDLLIRHITSFRERGAGYRRGEEVPTRGQGDRGARPPAHDCRRDLAGALHRALDGVGLAWADRAGQALTLEPPEPDNRYELPRPGRLVYVDVEKLGRISGCGAGHRVTGRRSPARRTIAGRQRHVTGFEFVHVMVDDHSRLAYAEVFHGRGENARQAVAFLRRGLRYFAEHGIEVERVMSDNGAGYISRAHAVASGALGVRHTRIHPGRPRTNKKSRVTLVGS